MIDDDLLHKYLRMAGYSEAQISNMTLETRLREDLGLDGDSFDETIALLHTKFGCDLSSFDGKRHANSEAALLFPFDVSRLFRWLAGKTNKFEPVTLRIIGEVLRSGRWST